MKKLAWAVCVALSVGVASPQRAHAEPWQDECVETLSDEEVGESLTFIENSFEKQRAGAIAWWTGWTSFNIFNLALGGYKYAVATTRLQSDSWLVSEIGAAAFVLQVAILPMPGMYAYHRMNKWPAQSAEQRRSKLVKSLKLLDKAAMVETTNSNLFAHLAGLFYATASSAYVWIRNRGGPPDRVALAVSLQFVTSVAFAEFTFWTVPRRARRDLKTVRGGACTHHENSATLHHVMRETDEASMSVSFFPGQIALTGKF